MLTQKRLKELLHYDPDTGIFTWKVQASRRTHIGDVAGCFDNKGYMIVQVDRQQYKAHRLAYLYVFGELPQSLLDHKDQDKGNNRIDNLRLSTNKQNQENTGEWSTNTSGFKGVSWNKRDRKWQAKITHNGVAINLGHFNTPEEASMAYITTRDKLFTHHQKKAA